VLTIAGVSLYRLSDDASWMRMLGFVLGVYILITVAVLCKRLITLNSGIVSNIRGISFSIKQGDIFNANGWRVISFNERFDTQVDNVILNESSLNGILITRLYEKDKENADKLRASILDKRNSRFDGVTISGETRYPLGCIRCFNEGKEHYMLLALARVDEHNKAHITWAEYVECLLNMWKEIDATYAGRSVYIPLLGSGVTRFDGKDKPLDFELLKCMIHTFQMSDVKLKNSVTILLTPESIRGINLYDLKKLL